jgi:hypothetical protein
MTTGGLRGGWTLQPGAPDALERLAVLERLLARIAELQRPEGPVRYITRTGRE